MQLVPEDPEKASAGSVRSPLLFVLFQQNSEVSSVMVASELARCVACMSKSELVTKPPSNIFQFIAALPIVTANTV